MRIIDASLRFIIDFLSLIIDFSSLNSSGLKPEEFNDENAMMKLLFSSIYVKRDFTPRCEHLSTSAQMRRTYRGL